MKAFLSLVVLLSAAQAFAGTEYFPCNYKKGMVISGTTGNRVSTTFNPRVIGLNRLEVALNDKNISITALTGTHVNVRGMANCYADEQKEGFDCYIARDLFTNRDLKVFLANDNSKRMMLTQGLGMPGGAFQQDEYSCLR